SGPHCPPLVVIAIEPNLSEVRKAMILGNLLRRQVAMVVDDRKIAREAMIKLDRAVVLQKEVIGDEYIFHNTQPCTSSCAQRRIFGDEFLVASGSAVSSVVAGKKQTAQFRP